MVNFITFFSNWTFCTTTLTLRKTQFVFENRSRSNNLMFWVIWFAIATICNQSRTFNFTLFLAIYRKIVLPNEIKQILITIRWKKKKHSLKLTKSIRLNIRRVSVSVKLKLLNLTQFLYSMDSNRVSWFKWAGLIFELFLFLFETNSFFILIFTIECNDFKIWIQKIIM